MKIIPKKFKDVFEIKLNPHQDNRGFFMRTFDQNIFNTNEIDYEWVQENHARSVEKGIIRGLHFQFPPHSETKLVRCVNGAILDVFVDLRKNSNTYGEWDSIKLSEDNYKCILIPRGFAHGYCTLTKKSDVLYKVDNLYTPDKEGGILWNDSELDIDWPIKEPIISEKDNNNMTFNEFDKKYNGLKI